MKHAATHTLYILSTAMLVACNDTGKWNGIAFSKASENVKIKTSELKEVPADSYVPEEDLFFDVSVDMDFMYPKETGDSVACSTINRYLITQLLNQPDGATQQEAIDGYIQKKQAEFKAEEYMVTCYDHVTGDATYGRKGIINYTFAEDFFGGGAHPVQNVIVRRFRATTGEPVGLWDVFVDSCSTSLKNLLTERLMDQMNVKTLEDLKEIGFLDMVDMFIPENFWMEADTLTFFFNQYEIAPYAMGQTSLSFSYDELKPYMK
ncbi:MAG: DUF3298 domain-containing protein [Bacteroidaceae bacterium]|nr:DUF3298 domain-containing protein [Bacteroidaceae bacterium]